MTIPPHVSSFIQALLFPPGLLLIGVVLGGVAALFGRRRLGFALFAAPVAVTLVLALPAVAFWIAEPLERRAWLAAGEAAALPRTVVVLGGAVREAGPDAAAAATGYDLFDAADRVVAAARLYREGKVDRVVLAGGSESAPSEAELMARFAVDLGVPRSALLLEGESRSTRENARNVAALLRARGLPPQVALVTSAIHMRRALREFHCVGIAAVAVPAEYEVLGAAVEFPVDWFPKLVAIDRARRGIKEWAGAMIGGCAER